MPIDLCKLGEYAKDSFQEENNYFLQNGVLSNWYHDAECTRLIEGLPGRREPHYVMVLARHLFQKYKVRAILDDGYWSHLNLKCDMFVEEKPGGINESGIFLELKIIPEGDEIDKLAAVKDDLKKLQLIQDDGRNFPHGIIIVAFAKTERLEQKIKTFVNRYGLNRWPYKSEDGLHRFPLDESRQYYNECIVGFWGRRDRRNRIINIKA